MTRALELTVLFLLLSWHETSGQQPLDSGVLYPPEGGVETLGSESLRGSVSCGDISGDIVVSVGAHFWTQVLGPQSDVIEVRHSNGIVLAFNSANASDIECCWLQFVWAEVLMSGMRADGQWSDELNLGGAILTAHGPISLTPTGESPLWAVDSASPRDEESACYDHAGPSLPRTAGDPSITILDMPRAPLQGLLDALERRMGTVVHRATVTMHFETYLVCGGSACARVTWRTGFRWTREDSMDGPVYYVDEIEQLAGGIRSEQQAVLDRTFPNQTTLAGGQ